MQDVMEDIPQSPPVKEEHNKAQICHLDALIWTSVSECWKVPLGKRVGDAFSSKGIWKGDSEYEIMGVRD